MAKMPAAACDVSSVQTAAIFHAASGIYAGGVLDETVQLRYR